MQDVLMERLRHIAWRLGVEIHEGHRPADVMNEIDHALDRINAAGERRLQAIDAVRSAAAAQCFGDDKALRAALSQAHKLLSADA